MTSPLDRRSTARRFAAGVLGAVTDVAREVDAFVGTGGIENARGAVIANERRVLAQDALAEDYAPESPKTRKSI